LSRCLRPEQAELASETVLAEHQVAIRQAAARASANTLDAPTDN
jgi:hypothetical protein